MARPDQLDRMKARIVLSRRLPLEAERARQREDVLDTLEVGQTVPDFTLTTYEPTTKGFGEFSLAEAKKNGKWTMLFFYPADYTFV